MAVQRLDVCMGKAGQLVGHLTYAQQGQRAYSTFAYSQQWLESPLRFAVSPDLPLVAGHSSRRAPSRMDSVFHLALADTAPDAWGRRVIARAHAKARKDNPTRHALTELDYLAAVDDFSRVGALRLRAASGEFLQSAAQGQRTTPPLIELSRMYSASRAVELSQETAEDLRYLQGKGTSLGGMRPKCTVLDEQGKLAIGKFPSVADDRSVTRGEVLAMRLARLAGIDAAPARIVIVGSTPVALIERFDRTADGSRIHYLSAASMLQASREEDRAYTEVVDAIRARCLNPTQTAQALWRRLVFNLLITNVDDHLQNLGFLYAGDGFWHLAPSFDLNPFPDKDRESKTWLSPDTGPIDSVQMLMAQAAYFSLQPVEALQSLKTAVLAVQGWRAVALGIEVGLESNELEAFAPAFEHAQMDEAKRLTGL